MIDIQKQLDEVFRLNREKQQAIKTVQTSEFKKVGLFLKEIHPDEKALMLNKVQKFYNTKIDGIYQGINKEREAAGQPLLTNPF